ncbi:MAG: cobalt-precorrin-5B (C(1))-methyltransferase, partial [Flavonifractor sp.]|nr:cobalt-precorrin-5B (C(1))-methyltransferase [Flavonifractor sp.]
MGKLELYIPVGRERLRCGYTTGTCAAAAAAGAAALLLEGVALPAVHIDTPAG